MAITNEERYLSNLELWAHSHPREAIWLQYIEGNSLEITPSTNGSHNLMLKGEESPQLYYSQEGPFSEANAWAATLELSQVEVLYVYGVGLGYYHDPLKEWLEKNPDHHVVFLEDNLEVLCKLFETEKGTELLSNSQVSIYFFREVAETEQIFNQLFWTYPMAKLGFGALKYYERTKTEKYHELRQQILYDAAIKNSLLEEYLLFGAPFYNNFYANLLHLNEAYLGNSLFGEFQSIPAIICGAGPSLEKNIDQLRSLSNKAIIFAGSSALNALDAKGIVPHLGAGIDPNQMQEQRLKNVKNLNFPFLYRNRLYPNALKLVTGPKLYITGSGGYDTAEWFENKFEIEGKFVEEGRNVVNFCLEIAYEMGCNPIIFVGMDLAYTGMKQYTGGVIDDPSLPKKEPVNETPIMKKSIYGEEVPTLWKWVSEAKWIGDFAANHPEVTLINATEGGLGFPQVPNTTLAEVAQEYLKKNHDLKSEIESVFESHSLDRITKERIVEAISELKESLQKCLGFLEALMEENEKIKTDVKTGTIEEHIAAARTAMLETELLNEPAFVSVLQIFNQVGSNLMQRDLMKLRNPANNSSPLEQELEKLDLDCQKYKFLSNAAKVNLMLIDQNSVSN